MLAAQVTPEGVSLERLFEEGEQVFVPVPGRAGQLRIGRRRGPARELPGALAGGGGNLGLLLLPEHGDEVRFEIEQVDDHPRCRELRVLRPGKAGVEVPLDRGGQRGKAGEIEPREVFGEPGLGGPAQEKVPAESEQHRFRAG